MKRSFCVGTYSEPILFGTGEVFHGKGKGLYFCTFEDGEIRVENVLPLRNPSFFCIHERAQRIYAVNELKEYEGSFGGGISELSYTDDGELKLLRSFCTGGTDPCHVALSNDGSYIAVSNFASGSVSVFPIESDGTMSGERRLFQHEGSSIHPKRQTGPHAHSAIFSRDGSFCVPDLGIDRLVRYNAEGTAKTGEVALKAGSGPRFGEFSADEKHFYLINEIASSVTHFTVEDGVFTERETVSTLPEEYEGENICSDLHLHPNGRFLYASNRGHDSICVFCVEGDGSLRQIERVPCGGRTPRNFCIAPGGEYALVGNQDSDNITTFRLGADGRMSVVSVTAFPTPVCIRFFNL